MKKYYKERFEARSSLDEKIVSLVKINQILQEMRNELRAQIPSAMETRILLLDPDAGKYTRPLQCILYDRPVNCLSCNRSRPVIKKALDKRRMVVVPESDPIERENGEMVRVGPEAAAPAFLGDDVLLVVSVVGKPGCRFTPKDFFLIEDFAKTARNVVLQAKKHWEMTEEKVRISKILSNISPFVPQSVLKLAKEDPALFGQEKEEKDVSVLFLDIEGYTKLSAGLSEQEVNRVVESLFSSFVDPIHRSQGDINETTGDGLMIIFKEDDIKTNAVNSIKAAFDIHRQSLSTKKELPAHMDPLKVNMGIHCGTALVGMTRFKGSIETRMTYTASGNVTNLAARLADHAEGGDILVAEETRDLIKGLWPVYDRGNTVFKGFSKPVHIYSLLREQ
ncbi:MAG: adenylate/guanylate cyclase domain-containing protein [Deltaproteobacteria bacterium]|nr:adenylate/guanylate cyclase domain-containing protein [Deltaproteobacteria bacterium]